MASIAFPHSRAGTAWQTALVIVAAALSILLFWLAVPDRPSRLIFAAAMSATFGLILAIGWGVRRARARDGHVGEVSTDPTLLNALASISEDGVAITDRNGRLASANSVFEHWFGGLAPPPMLGLDPASEATLADLARAAWRDGAAREDALTLGDATYMVELLRTGLADDYLLWRFRTGDAAEAARRGAAFIGGWGGNWLGSAGVMIALIDQAGNVLAINAAMVERSGADIGAPFADLVHSDPDGQQHFVREGEDGPPVRLLALPLDGADSGMILVALDDYRRGGGTRDLNAQAEVRNLLGTLPLGLAFVDREGRFMFINDAFRRAALIEGDDPVYPGDLVVKEDKSAVSDAIRRFAAGRAIAGDTAVRLLQRPEEPIALTIATARGLGEAAVLLSLKDNSEESKLKRQVAQATKMQAVGQLAGGVAHDFNNILTAIIGHCDLMMMRHAPGDSDYDDIQQIKHNSNRAASLTRQLLAFSRQQTLRPQVLQLPDVISEISNLLQRLLGETVKLVVKHGRGLGPVRADPGQLEQVIVNLAVNARDAMQEKGEGGGTLTLQTYAVSANEARRIDSDILPPADYVALGVSDTGTGIPPEVLGKIFEPFFTTKEIGKGTGLGLSTVYGIVKQTGGFIFADSTMGRGTTFTIYLPVHHGDKEAEAVPVSVSRAKPQELWGTGTILLVEDEAMVRAVAERALARQGYQVLTATNGEEALEVLSSEDRVENPIDLLISDVVMPMMDGPTLVREARGMLPDLPILFMSGYAEEQLRSSITIDHVDFLPKPFSVQKLCESVRDALKDKKG